MSFSSLNLHESVQHALAAAGYTEPTPVQAEAVPAALERRDLIVSAQTGTGKTAAFMLPALSAIADEPRKPGRGPRVLVLTPTRELAQQVTTAAQKYGSEIKGLRTVSVLGGMPFPAQNRLLARPYDIMVATPGRLLDHLGRGRIVFERLDMLVLDEADRMLDMGFIDDVEAIAAACPPERQTLLFSATFEDRMAKLAESLLKNPHRIDIAGHQTKHESIAQKAYFADDQDHKKKLLMHMLSGVDVNQAIVFAGTRVDAVAGNAMKALDNGNSKIDQLQPVLEKADASLAKLPPLLDKVATTLDHVEKTTAQLQATATQTLPRVPPLVRRTENILEGVDSPYATELFQPIVAAIQALATQPTVFGGRVIADHIRAAVFILAAGVRPGNVDQPYVARRLIRRAKSGA